MYLYVKDSNPNKGSLDNITGLVIRSRKDAVKFIRGRMTGQDMSQEHVITIGLDAMNHPLYCNIVAIGTQNKTIVEPRDVFRYALKHNAAGIITAHNHPSGDTKPSEADRAFFKRMRDAGELIGVEIIDNITINNEADKYDGEE